MSCTPFSVGNRREAAGRRFLAPGALLAVLFGLLLLGLGATAHAGTYYWDNNGTASGFGISGGTWDTTDAYWNTSSTGVAPGPAAYTTTTSDALWFGTGTYGLGAGTVNVSGVQNASSITFGSQSGALTLSGGTITTPGTITVNNTSDTISSCISSSATYFVQGSGALTLSGGGNLAGGLNPLGYNGTLTLAGPISMGSAVYIGNAGYVQTLNINLNQNWSSNFVIGVNGSGGTANIGSGVSGTGSIAGPVIIAGGAAIGNQGTINLVDNTIGTLTLNASSGTALTLGGGAYPAALDFEIGNNAVTSDQIAITGGKLAVNGGVITITPQGTVAPGTYNLITTTGAGQVSGLGSLSLVTSGVRGFQDDVVRWGFTPPQPDFPGPLRTMSTLILTDYQFGSARAGVAQFVFCDGAVRTVRYAVDPTVFSYACSRNDGKAYNTDSL